MRDVAEQLVNQDSTLARDHDRESLGFEEDYQKLNIASLNLSHGQDIDTLNRSSLLTSGRPGPMVTAPQLPVEALKPDHLSFSISTAHLPIWKEAYHSHHRASEFDHYPIVKQQAFYSIA